jgi:hypothetical protein
MALSVGDHVGWHYRSAYAQGRIVGIFKKADTDDDTGYVIRPDAQYRHPGEPATLHHYGRSLTKARSSSVAASAVEQLEHKVELSAKTPLLSTVHRPLGKPGGPGLFHTKGLQLPAYIQNIAHALIKHGHPKSMAIAIAIGTVKRWSRGGGKVSPEVRAAAVKALAEWEAAKVRARATPNK